MIMSRFGCEIEITGVFEDDWVRATRKEDGAIRDYRIVDLRADRGYEEIAEAMKGKPRLNDKREPEIGIRKNTDLSDVNRLFDKIKPEPEE